MNRFAIKLPAIVFTLLVSINSLSQVNTFIKGADGSFVNQVEDAGGKYYDDGTEKDVLQIFKDNGFNYIRLKLWHTPENEYNSLPNVMEMAKRAKDLGYGFLLDFHYSDTWADPGHQEKPASWEGLAFNILADSIYEYTKYVITQLKSQNTLPDMVQIGNEITCGMLWDDGKVCNPETPQQWNQLGILIKRAIEGLNESLDSGEEVKVIIHFDNGASNSGCRWFYDNILDQEIEFNIIGLSYYPWWHGTLTELKNNLNDLSPRYKKDIIVVEGGYPWTLAWNDNVNNIIGSTEQLHPGYPATVEGQANFLKEVMDIIHKIPENRGKGFMYWSPEWVTAPQLGSPWENVALFNFDNEVLESIKVFDDQSGNGEGIMIKPFKLNNPHPNPFRTKTTIEFKLKSKEMVELTVYNAIGRKVDTIINKQIDAGNYSIQWNATGLPAGVYYLRFQSGGFIQARNVVIL